ncbi:CidA/LrgA family protein [Morganella psychrotolerans]|uniref:UPF0299 membrane protein AYY18_09870 n=1 Tax=Morganella psychrotolerans TaxID=368603 RepID=A0A1B8H594_9GAMM|nr:CidA/LrgA family protein [Morganella psychrotolerans]OBU04236.1 hypothetical protein AYY18_09870 [Morganella psychrotolerans]
MKPKQIAETGWRYLRAFIILYLCLFAGNIIVVLLPFSVPGSIAGMLLLFVLLALQILPAHWVQPGCTLLMKNMTMLFLPIGIGVMNYYDTLSAQLLPILIACVVSTFVAMCAVALSSEYIHRRHVPVAEQQEADAVAAITEQQEKPKC